MTIETLRGIIVEKQRPRCKGEPGPDAIANYLGAWWWWIFDTDDPVNQQKILSQFGYSTIKDLRADTDSLIEALREELEEKVFSGYFPNQR